MNTMPKPCIERRWTSRTGGIPLSRLAFFSAVAQLGVVTRYGYHPPARDYFDSDERRNLSEV
jgi:hypothetical protein